MTTNFEFLLFGQAFGYSGRIYSYPISIAEYNQKGFPTWINKLPADARFIRSISTEDCFSVRWGQEGISYAYTFTPMSSRDSKLMLILHTKQAVVSDAKELIKSFRSMADYVVNRLTLEEIKTEDIQTILNPISTILRQISMGEIKESAASKDCVIVYQSEEELEKLMLDVAQKEYLSYGWIHFVNQACYKTMIDGEKYVLLPLSKVKDCYFVDKPAEVGAQITISVTPNYAAIGDNIEITYAKSNGLVCKQTARVGYPSEYILAEASNVYRVKSAQEVTLKFTKEVPIVVEDLFGKTIDDFSIDYSTSHNKVVYVEENQVKPITISAHGYCDKKIKVSAEQEKLRVVLEADDRNPSYAPQQSEYHFKKLPFIISCILVTFIWGFVCFFSGKAYQSMIDDKEITQKDDKIKELEDDLQQVKSQLENARQQLQQRSDQSHSSSSRNGGISGSGSHGGTASTTIPKTTVQQYAMEYLKQKNAWSTAMMIRYCMDKNKSITEEQVKATNEYKFLEKLVHVSSATFNEVIQFSIENQKWKDFQGKITNQRNSAGISINDIINNIKNDNISTPKSNQAPTFTL